MANNPKESSIPILLGELVSAGDEHLQQGIKNKIFRATPISGKLAIYGWALPIERGMAARRKLDRAIFRSR
jgi:hypothetical protein